MPRPSNQPKIAAKLPVPGQAASLPALLPPNIAAWFAHRGWTPHAHQLEMLEAANAGENALLVAPTGGGKTLAGFLPSLIDLAERPRPGLHTLYISPLKALAVPVLLEIGRESVWGEAREQLLAEAEEEIIREATGLV